MQQKENQNKIQQSVMSLTSKNSEQKDMDDNDSEFFAKRGFIEMSRTTLDTLRTDLKKKHGGKSRRTQTHTKYYRQLRNAESGRNSTPHERAYQLAIQKQMVITKNMRTSNIIQNKYCSYQYICIYIYACNNN